MPQKRRKLKLKRRREAENEPHHDDVLSLPLRKKVKCIRLGHPARVSGDLQQHSLEALISTSDQTQIVRDIYAEIDSLLLASSKKGNREQRPRVRSEIKELRKELRERERKVLKELLLRAEVILGENVDPSASLSCPISTCPFPSFPFPLCQFHFLPLSVLSSLPLSFLSFLLCFPCLFHPIPFFLLCSSGIFHSFPYFLFQ